LLCKIAVIELALNGIHYQRYVFKGSDWYFILLLCLLVILGSTFHPRLDLSKFLDYRLEFTRVVALFDESLGTFGTLETKFGKG
jgi:hypothetical protein